MRTAIFCVAFAIWELTEKQGVYPATAIVLFLLFALAVASDFVEFLILIGVL